MLVASEEYLVELAEQFLASQMKISWRHLKSSDFKGETTWIDPRADQPGTEVEVNYHRLSDAIEIEVIAYQPDDEGSPIVSVRRIASVRMGQ